MLFSNRRRVDEDLERIRKANLSPQRLSKESDAVIEEERKLAQNMELFGLRDYFAMIIAIFSIIFPYLLIFGGLLGVFWLVIRFMM